MIHTILVVDDDELTRSSIERLLVDAEYEVMLAHDGKQGLQLALQHHPDLIMTDLMMPEMDGHAMLRELRKDEWGSHAKVIILSANETVPAINEALQSNVTAYFSKTDTNLDDLIEQISAMN